MKCDCDQKLNVLQITDYSQFTSQLEVVAVKHAEWVKLCRCLICGQHWQVDKWDKYQVICAIKIENPESWQIFDDEESRLQLLISSRGGLSNKTCMWVGCNNKALKELAFCPQHAWTKGLRA